MKAEKTFNWLMTTAVLLVLAIPVGIANLYLGYVVGESPCTKCWFERIGMVIIGILGVFIIRYGPKIKYIACVFLFSAFGLYMTVRQSVIYWFLDVGEGHGGAIFGVHTNTWAVLVFWVCLLFMGGMMFFITQKSVLMQDMINPVVTPKPFTRYAKVVVILSTIVVASNAFQALILQGYPPYTGKAQPDRFSLNLPMMTKTWTTRLWGRLHQFNIVGDIVIDDPYIEGISMPKDVFINQPFMEGPVATSAGIAMARSSQLINPQTFDIKKSQEITGVAYDPNTGEYAFVTEDLGVYYADPDLRNGTGHVIFDKPNGPDMKYVIDGGFSGNKLMVMASNKAITGVEKTEHYINELLQWEVFRETTGGIAPATGRGRINMTTVRGKWANVDAFAIGDNNLYAITLPNKITKEAVLERFSTKDWTITGELPLTASPDLSLKPDRNVSDYYVTGLAWKDGKLYAISPRYHSLLIIDPNNAQVEKVYQIEGLTSPRSAFFKDGKLYALDMKEDKIYLTEIDIPS